MKHLKRLAPLFAVTVLTGCLIDGPSGSASKTTTTFDGTTAERIANIEKIIGANGPLPSALVDAQGLEEQLGDGRLGPSDYRFYCWIKIAAEDVAAWKQTLTPLSGTAEDMQAPGPPAWWLSPAQFQALPKFGPKPLFGRTHGWVAIAADGNIWVMTFTM